MIFAAFSRSRSEWEKVPEGRMRATSSTPAQLPSDCAIKNPGRCCTSGAAILFFQEREWGDFTLNHLFSS